MLETAQISAESTARNSNTSPIQIRLPKRHMRSNTHQGSTFSSQRFTPLSEHHSGVGNGTSKKVRFNHHHNHSHNNHIPDYQSNLRNEISIDYSSSSSQQQEKENEENKMVIKSNNSATPSPPSIAITIAPPSPAMIKSQPPVPPRLGLPKSTPIIGHYAVIKVIGNGSFSEVKLAIDLKTCDKVALKMIPTKGIEDNDRIKASALREVELLKFMNHPNVVHLHDTIDTSTHLCLVMEYVAGGELFDYVSDYYEQTSETDAKRIFLQLVNVVAYLHDNNIVHRDLKLENILLTERGPSLTGPIIKLTDFGLARTIDPSSPILTTRCGSEEYAAPELLLSGAYDGRQTDIWSLGIILYVLLVGYLPFDLEPGQRRRFISKIAQADYEFPKSEKETGRRSTISAEAKDLVKIILQSNPKKRATLDQIRQHPWLEGVVV
ncbi:417_t:CDS:2 [Ambispora gerdemannii]|uniref:417_t:CDS:1 n=1 Tax=Ambispora gerdemannii TaxID=144530 RepID=A0A9N8WN48_9GLOM|nr:417_t:CDS:2 [Ambispora gerdemannii]